MGQPGRRGGGLVGLISSDTSIETTSDPATGNYVIYSPTALAAGTYTVVCGDDWSYVSPGGYAYLQPSLGTEYLPINAIELA